MAFFLHSFSSVIIVGDYYVNTASYMAHCENKANISMHCNGKCQMVKKIQHEEEKDKNSPENKTGTFNFYYLPEQSINWAVAVSFEQHKIGYPLLNERSTMDRPHSIFKPPA